jgi:hypothetical protein
MHNRFDYVTPNVKYKKGAKDEYCPAFLINYSESGMFLRTSERMDIGQQITIKMEETREDTTGPEKYDAYNGTVRWVENFQTKSDNLYYMYGIEYNQPVNFF